MKRIFKKLVGIGLLCFASVVCGASSNSEKREQVQKQLLVSQEEFDKIPFEDTQWGPCYLESAEDKINYGKRLFASKNFKIMCEDEKKRFLFINFFRRIFKESNGIEAFISDYVRDNFETLMPTVIMQFISCLGSEK